MEQRKDKFTVVGLGEILWDILPAGKQLGGAPANFAYHAQALGARGVVASCIGDDPLGKEILARLLKVNLDSTHIIIDSPLIPTLDNNIVSTSEPISLRL